MNSSINTERLSDSVFDHEEARKCLSGMGETSENVAEKYGISREKQDKMAVESHQKAYKAQKAGLYKCNYHIIFRVNCSSQNNNP
jgi:acetyl-CoA acyltransferase 1